MKHIIFLVYIFSWVLIPARAQDKEAGTEGAVISFNELSHNFGDITQGEKVNYVFSFSNTGNQPLLLSNVLVQCGCTATNWPRQPVLPGKEAKIAVTFDSSGKTGIQNKVITVVSNAINAHERVKIITNVMPKK